MRVQTEYKPRYPYLFLNIRYFRSRTHKKVSIFGIDYLSRSTCKILNVAGSQFVLHVKNEPTSLFSSPIIYKYIIVLTGAIGIIYIIYVFIKSRLLFVLIIRFFLPFI